VGGDRGEDYWVLFALGDLVGLLGLILWRLLVIAGFEGDVRVRSGVGSFLRLFVSIVLCREYRER
jgi:hypothetical protein